MKDLSKYRLKDICWIKVMYVISVYDENKKHIENINNVTFELTQRVYDFDNFNAEGISTIDFQRMFYDFK